MSLNTLTCYQPRCDAADCRYVIEGDAQYHYRDADEATRAWREWGGWTDGTTWICEDHVSAPHLFVGSDAYCDRCDAPEAEHLPLAAPPSTPDG